MAEKGKRLKALELLRKKGAPAKAAKPAAAEVVLAPVAEGIMEAPKKKGGVSTHSEVFRAFTGQDKPAADPKPGDLSNAETGKHSPAKVADSKGHVDSGVFIEPDEVPWAASPQKSDGLKALRDEIAQLRTELKSGLDHEKEMRHNLAEGGKQLNSRVNALEGKLNSETPTRRFSSEDTTMINNEINQTIELKDIDLEQVSGEEPKDIELEQLTTRHQKVDETMTRATLSRNQADSVLAIVDAYARERNFATKEQLDQLTANVRKGMKELQRGIVGLYQNLSGRIFTYIDTQIKMFLNKPGAE